MDNKDLQVLCDFLDKKLDEKLKPFAQRLDNIINRLDNVSTSLKEFKEGQAKIEEKLDSIIKQTKDFN